MNSDKSALAESLDLTKVQYKDEASKFEAEKSILLAEHKEKLGESAAQLVQLMKDMGVNIESQTEADEDSQDFNSLI